MNEMAARIETALAPLRKEEPDKRLFDLIVERALDENVYGTSGYISRITGKLVPVSPNVEMGISEDIDYFGLSEATEEVDIILREDGRRIDEKQANELKYRISAVFLPIARAVLREIRPEAMTVAAIERDLYKWEKELFGPKSADESKEMRRIGMILEKRAEEASKRQEDIPREKKASCSVPSGQADSSLHEERKAGVRGASGLFDF